MTAPSREERASPSGETWPLCLGWAGAHSDCIRHVVHSPRADEVGKVLQDFQGRAFLLLGKLALVGRVQGQPKGILDIGQQVQAEETHGDKQKQKLKEK